MARRIVSEAGRSKVALVIGQLSAGGAEGQLALLARSLRGSSFEPVVYCVSGQSRPIGPELEKDGIPVRVVDGAPPLRIRKLGRAMDDDGVRLVHSWLFIGNTYAWLANRGARPLITSARNCKRQGRVHDIANRFAFRASRCIVANSEQVRDYIVREYDAPQARIAVIRNGVDVARFHPAETPPSLPLIVGMGRLVPQKDPLLFVRAAARVAKARPDVRFAFVGEGPMRGEIEAEMARQGLSERMSLPGETRDVPAILQQASLFWLTSAWEGLPNVVLEAMGCGVPVIGADVGGTRELVRPGIEGELVRSGDETAFVEHSLALLGDESKRREYARRSRQRAEEFSTAKMVEAMRHAYAEALS